MLKSEHATSTHSMENDMVVFRNLLNLVIISVRSYYSVDAKFVDKYLGFVGTTDEGGYLKGVTARVVKKTGEHCASNVACA